MWKNVICGLICVAIIVASGGFAGAEQKKKGTSGVTVRTEQVKIVVPDDVKEAWQSVDLSVTDKKSNSSQIVSVDIGKEIVLPGSSLKLSVDAFLPAFKMEGATITTDGAEPSNPAAKIRIKDKGKVIYEGWLYEKWPTSHPFEHPQVAVSLAGYNRKEGKAEAIEDVPEITIKKVVYQKNVEEKAVPKNLIDMDPFHVFNTDYPIEMAAFSPDGKYLAMIMIGATKELASRANQWVGSRSLIIKVWEVGSWKEVINKVIVGSETEKLSTMAFSPDCAYLAIGSNHNKIYVFKVDGMEELERKDWSRKDERGRFRNNGGGVSSIAFSQDGRYLTTADESNYPSGKLRIFEVGSWKELNSIDYEINHKGGFRSVAFSPDSRLLAAAGEGSIRILNTGSWNEVFSIKDSTHTDSITFSPDNTLLVGRKRFDVYSEISVYEVGGWNKLQEFKATRRAQFSSDSRLLIVQYGQNSDNLRILEVGNWNELYDIRGMGIKATNGKWIIATYQDKLLALDMSPIAAYYLRNDLGNLNFMPKSAELKSRLEKIETDFQDKAKVIESEKNDALAKLGSTKKDEFETEAVFKNRMDQRDADIKNINNLFKENLLPIRRERAANRIKLYEELNTILDATRKPVKFDISLKTYNADAELFPLSIMENGVEFYSAFVKVPKDKAKGFKENIAKYQVSGETQLDRSGRIKIVNAAIKDAEGASYPISNPRLSGDVIFTGTY